MNDQQLLITINRDWADEFSVEGMVVMSGSAWLEHLEMAERYFEKNGSAEVYFGTNEFIDWHSFKDYKDSFEVKELTSEQFNVLKDLFTVKGYTWEHPKGTPHVVPDKIEFGIIPMLKDDDE